MTFRPRTFVIASLLLVGCATVDRPNPSNLAAYCTPENAYRLGSQGHAYLGVCPKESEARFLEGLARGRQYRPWTPAVESYYQRMDQTERQLVAAASETERAQLRTRLADLDWWALHILNTKGTYHQ